GGRADQGIGKLPSRRRKRGVLSLTKRTVFRSFPRRMANEATDANEMAPPNSLKACRPTAGKDAGSVGAEDQFPKRRYWARPARKSRAAWSWSSYMERGVCSIGTWGGMPPSPIGRLSGVKN